MTDRPAFLGGLALAALLGPTAAVAQVPPRVARLGGLGGAESDAWKGLRQGLRERGWEEGWNLQLDFRFAGGREDRYRELAAELVRLNVDVLAAGNSQATSAAKTATSTIPIVMFSVSHPVEAGFVASLARPGGNVTGVSNQLADLNDKLLELLRETGLSIRRVGVIWAPNNLGSALALRELEPAAQRAAVTLLPAAVHSREELPVALAALARERPDALYVHPVPSVWNDRAMVAEFAVKHRLPSISGLRQFADSGLLMSYGPSLLDQGRQAAALADKILRGAKPADLPVEQPTRFELALNLKTAAATRLTVPPALLLRADHVIR